MTKTFSIFGASDDLIETAGIDGCDEFYRKGNYLLAGTFSISSEREVMEIFVHAVYDGHWCFAVGTRSGDDYNLFPNWKITRMWGETPDGFGSPYSEYMEIEVPDDAVLKRIDGG